MPTAIRTVVRQRGRSLVFATLAAPLLVASTQAPVERRLYVANDEERRIDVFDVNDNHALHRSSTRHRSEPGRSIRQNPIHYAEFAIDRR